MKKLIAILLALTLMLALCACGNEGVPYVPPVSGNGGNGGNAGTVPVEPEADTTAPTEAEEEKGIVGVWVAEFDMLEAMGIDEDNFAEEFGIEDEEMAELIRPEEIMVTMTFEFTDDGEVSYVIDGEDAIDDWKDQIRENGVAYIEALMEESDITEEQFEEEFGMTPDEYVEEELVNQLPFEDLELYEEEESTYELDGDKLYFDGDEDFYYTVDIDGDFMTMDNDEDMGEYNFVKDLVFERQ